MFTGLMMNTWIAASIVAVIAGVTGFFAVLRGATFAAHAIPNGAFAGAAGASLLGVNTLVGLGVFAVVAAVGIGVQRRRGRDVATGVVLGAALGAAALFLYLGTLTSSTTWLGILLAYDSYYWPPHGRGWPVSFFVVTLITGGYLISYLRPGGKPAETPAEPEHACSVALC